MIGLYERFRRNDNQCFIYCLVVAKFHTAENKERKKPL